MIKFENTEVVGWKHAIRGMRNPLNSWENSDSHFECEGCQYVIESNDLGLMHRLIRAGTDHRKFMRMITVYVDITAPMYWWSEFDTYKVGTVANSTSKMHKLLSKPFEMSDFSFDKLLGYKNDVKYFESNIDEEKETWKLTAEYEECARPIVDTLNKLRDAYYNLRNEEFKKNIWYAILQILPNSYNQKRTVMLNYEVLANIYKSRKNHKLDEWSIGFMGWIQTLPYNELITGKFEDTKR